MRIYCFIGYLTRLATCSSLFSAKDGDDIIDFHHDIKSKLRWYTPAQKCLPSPPVLLKHLFQTESLTAA